MFRRQIEVDSALIASSRSCSRRTITEIEVQRGDQRVRVARGGPA